MRAIKFFFTAFLMVYCLAFAFQAGRRVVDPPAPAKVAAPAKKPRWVTEPPESLTGDDRKLAEAYRRSLVDEERAVAGARAEEISKRRLRSAQVRVHMLASRGTTPLSWTAEDNQDVTSWWWFQLDREGFYKVTPGDPVRVAPKTER